MNTELNLTAVELSDAELDTVAGGLAVTIGDAQGYESLAGNNFAQKTLQIAQQTFAGPTGSGTASVFNLQEISSGAFQGIKVG